LSAERSTLLRVGRGVATIPEIAIKVNKIIVEVVVKINQIIVEVNEIIIVIEPDLVCFGIEVRFYALIIKIVSY
jgi:hypothetical protein